MWLVNNMQRIMSFVNSVVNSITAIAAGQIGGAAAFIEGAIAKTIPMILSGLAQFLRLGGITKKIQEAIIKVSKPIDKAINKGITAISKKVKSWFGESKGGKKKVSKDKVDKQVKKDEKNELGKFKPERFTMAGAGHTMSFEGNQIIMASTKGSLTKKVDKAENVIEADSNNPNWKGKIDIVKSGLNRIKKVEKNFTS